MFASLLIANRGEIACRIIRTARTMGLRTIAVHSDADAGALHARLADEAVAVGPAPAAESYLNVAAILAAAKRAGADAIHPGYGFLAENADFAEAVAAAGLHFVGPPPAAIRAMGAKDAAKRAMEAAGVPVVPGCHEDGATPGRLAGEAERIGYPVLLKAAFGGGGKGMRRVDGPDDFAEALRGAAREAKAAFGDGRMILEKLIAAPRHIEVQVFADRAGETVHLFERDCTLQRRHQKVVEEAPAPGMTDRLRRRMTGAAIAAARAVGYVGAGTVEFIVDGSVPLGDETAFYFMEMNTRLQVEHPVTEMVTGFDLVEWQLRVAAGEPLPCRQGEIGLDGHAVEARLYAETPETGFLPSTGPVLAFEPATGEGIRCDAGVETGDEVSEHYDPMIAKVIAHGSSREEALRRLDDALGGTCFIGPETNQAFLRLLLADADFAAGRMDTGLVDRKLAGWVAALEDIPEAMLGAGVAALLAPTPAASAAASPWSATDAFQTGPARRQSADIAVRGAALTVGIEWTDGIARLAESACRGGDDVVVVADGDGVALCHDGRQLRLRLADPFTQAAGETGDGELRAPMPGLVSRVAVAEGDEVAAGATLLVLEAMKMEHGVRAPFAGRVAGLAVAAGDRVAEGDRLVRVEAAA
jgi:3-methylcrotonyl-CoA carboxylase alpha subunit